MIALGICDGHDAGAALAIDGRVVAAVSEERFTRVKRQPGFPKQSIDAVLALAGVTGRDIDRVAVAEITGRAAFRALASIYRGTIPNRPADRATNRFAAWAQNRIANAPAVAAIDAAVSRRVLSARLRARGIMAPLTLVDHHRAHALCAAHGSGFDDALVVTMDAFGDGASATVSTWRDGALTEIDRTPFHHSAALLYGRVTAHLGFSEGEEGKVAGLAARGDADRDRHRVAALIGAADGRVRMADLPSPARLDAVFRHWPAEDVAAVAQRVIEDVVSGVIAVWAERTGATRIALAGGLFANVRLNQVVARRCRVRDLDVFPHMGDGGLCVGAAWAVSPPGEAARMPIFLGPDPGPTPESIRRDDEVRASALGDEAIRRLAALMDAGGVVGVVRGNMEFGPRALGHRSLIFSAARPGVATALGRALGRPDIMPFAPVVRARDFSALSDDPPLAAFSRMTATATATARPGVAARYPVAVHADGSMRIQTVEPNENPLLHAILDALAPDDWPPMMINTSFNRHSEPIVMTAAIAIERAREWRLAALVLNDDVLEFAA